MRGPKRETVLIDLERAIGCRLEADGVVKGLRVEWAAVRHPNRRKRRHVGITIGWVGGDDSWTGLGGEEHYEAHQQ
jgi:hypothetical protein